MAQSPKGKITDDDAVKLQFVSALDAWVTVEHALGKLFYVLLKPIPYYRSQVVFSSMNGFQAQREAVAALTEERLESPENVDLRERISRVLDRARGLATKRNRLIHGKWQYVKGEPRRLIRIYLHPNPARMGKPSETWVFDQKGKITFFIDDLERCENEFAALCSDINGLLPPVAARVGVSPHIEIPIEEVLELKILSNPQSGRPPESS